MAVKRFFEEADDKGIRKLAMREVRMLKVMGEKQLCLCTVH